MGGWVPGSSNTTKKQPLIGVRKYQDGSRAGSATPAPDRPRSVHQLKSSGPDCSYRLYTVHPSLRRESQPKKKLCSYGTPNKLRYYFLSVPHTRPPGGNQNQSLMQAHKKKRMVRVSSRGKDKTATPGMQARSRSPSPGPPVCSRARKRNRMRSLDTINISNSTENGWVHDRTSSCNTSRHKAQLMHWPSGARRRSPP